MSSTTARATKLATRSGASGTSICRSSTAATTFWKPFCICSGWITCAGWIISLHGVCQPPTLSQHHQYAAVALGMHLSRAVSQFIVHVHQELQSLTTVNGDW